MSDRRLLAMGLLLALVSITACVKTAEPREIPVGDLPDPTANPSPISFPRDSRSHDSRLEWWYHSGHLETIEGKEFGFHFVVFKADDGIGEPNLVAQMAILDVETGEHYESSRAVAGFDDTRNVPMTIDIADWVYRVSGTAGGHIVDADDEQLGLTLDFIANEPVMLHNEIGWLPTEAGATYYYSWPRQQVVGELNLNGQSFEVSGTGWFDHQWGNFFVLGKPAGWQWFAIQLDDGGSLMITESRGIDGEIADTYGTYMSAGGEVTHLTSGDDGIELTVVDEWTSPTTGGIYPSGWTMEIESLALNLTLEPLADDQEVQGGLPAASTYWEGKVGVEGSQADKPISGDAYVELSGYVDPEPIEWMQR